MSAATDGEASIKGPQMDAAHGYTPGYEGVYLVRLLPPYAPICGIPMPPVSLWLF